MNSFYRNLYWLAMTALVSTATPAFAHPFVFKGSDCTVFNTIPNEASEESVPLNSSIDVFFYSSHPEQCITRFELIDELTHRAVPTTVRYQTSWQPLEAYKDRYYTLVRYQPSLPLMERHPFSLHFNGQLLTTFVTGTDQEGGFIDMVPAIFKFPGCPLKAAMSPEDIHLCGQRLIQYFFTMGSSVLNQKKESLMKDMSLADKEIIAAYANPKTLFDALPTLTDNRLSQGITGVNLYRMRYFSRDAFGRSVIVSGLFARPSHPRFNEKRVPIITLLHVHAPQQSSPSDGNMLETFFAMSLASHGFYVFAPDNLGHGVSESAVEPFFFPITMFDIHKDGLQALLEGLNLENWNGQLSIFGGSQGAFDGMNLFRYLNTMSYPYDIRNVYLSEGPMNIQRQFTDVMKYELSDGHFTSPYVTYVKYDIPGLLGLAQLYVQQRESYNRLPRGMALSFFVGKAGVVHDEVRKFLSFDPQYLAFHTEILGSTLLNNTDTYDAPNTHFRIYAYPKDTLVAASSGEDMLRFLMKKDNHFAHLERGSCRENSRIEMLVRTLIPIQPEITHVYCILIAADDFMKTMLSDYRVYR